MLNTKIVTAVIAVILLAAACGDDSAGNAGNPFGPANQSDDIDLEDLLDNDGDIDLGELLDGVTGEDGEVDLGNILESAQDVAESFGDSGSGTVQINGDTINFSSETCFAFGDGDFSIEGGGTTGDGTPVWVSISRSEDTRAELLEYLTEETLDLVYGDADPVISASVEIEYGKSELFGQGEDTMPDFNASDELGSGEFELNLSGRSVSGRGSAVDFNYVLGDFDDSFDFTFEAGCN